MYNSDLLKAGLLNIGYFIFANLKDSTLLLYYMFCGGEKGFDRALTIHAISLPLDILAMLALSIWGSTTIF